jgi:hypothetical protein
MGKKLQRQLAFRTDEQTNCRTQCSTHTGRSGDERTNRASDMHHCIYTASTWCRSVGPQAARRSNRFTAALRWAVFAKRALGEVAQHRPRQLLKRDACGRRRQAVRVRGRKFAIKTHYGEIRGFGRPSAAARCVIFVAFNSSSSFNCRQTNACTSSN